MNGSGGGPNTHLHVFFSHRDPTDNRWYFFDPYGIYSYPACYPALVNAAANTACARYPVAWKNGSPTYVPQTLANSINSETASLQKESCIAADQLSIAPNPSMGNIIVKYDSKAGGNVDIVIYDKTGAAIFSKRQHATIGKKYMFSKSYEPCFRNVLP